MGESQIPRIEHFEWYLERQRMKAAMMEMFRSAGVDVDEAELERIVKTPTIRNVYIRSIYNNERRKGVKAEYLYYKLGEIFGIDGITVRNIVHNSDAKNMPEYGICI